MFSIHPRFRARARARVCVCVCERQHLFGQPQMERSAHAPITVIMRLSGKLVSLLLLSHSKHVYVSSFY